MTSKLKSTGFAALSFTVSAAVFAITLSPAVASAATVESDVEVVITGERQISTKQVSYADLDLTDAADLKRLSNRIGAAVSDVCETVTGGRFTLSDGTCRSEARRSADQQVAAIRSSANALAAATAAGSNRTIAVVAAR